MYKVIKSGTNRKLVFDFLLVLRSIAFAVKHIVYENLPLVRPAVPRCRYHLGQVSGPISRFLA